MTLKEYLETNNINLTKLSEQTGICMSLLSKIKSGKAKTTDNVKRIFKEKLNVELEDSPTREQQLEKQIEKLLKDVYMLTSQISNLKLLLMEKDLIIDSLAHQIRNLHKYSRPKMNKQELYKDYKVLLDKYNKLCYNIDTEDSEL